MHNEITGSTASEIADSIRGLCDRGVVTAGAALPPVRDLAARLGVNRNTVVAAYRVLAQAGIVEGRGRLGTVVVEPRRVAPEGIASDSVLRDLGTGNPDPTRIPDPLRALASLDSRPVLYGEPAVDAGLAAWAESWCATDLGRSDLSITVTSGAVDAVERLLAQALTRDDAVALEEPCFLASIHTARLAGYRSVALPLDDEGITVAGLQAALDAGVRAIVCTPRAQNPTGVSLSPARATALRAILADHPYVLIIEDDHYSLLSQRPYQSLIGPDHQRFALIRSVSKFLGPDMSLAVAATDGETAHRLAMRLSPGTTWVSHLLQRLTLALLTDDVARAQIAAAGRHYQQRHDAVSARLRAAGLAVTDGEGVSVWVTLPLAARTVADRLMRRGWLVRTGDDFALETNSAPTHHLRLTAHDLSDDKLDTFARDLAAASDLSQ